LLRVKENHKTLLNDISAYVQDDNLQKTIDIRESAEKNRGRTERRTAYSTADIDWLFGKDGWARLACIGAIHIEVTSKNNISSDWHYYISNKPLSSK
jgi:hypothetical protein